MASTLALLILTSAGLAHAQCAPDPDTATSGQVARRTLERSGVWFVGSLLNRRRNYIPAFLEEML